MCSAAAGVNILPLVIQWLSIGYPLQSPEREVKSTENCGKWLFYLFWVATLLYLSDMNGMNLQYIVGNTSVFFCLPRCEKVSLASSPRHWFSAHLSVAKASFPRVVRWENSQVRISSLGSWFVCGIYIYIHTHTHRFFGYTIYIILPIIHM